jgi:hypothetical protein
MESLAKEVGKTTISPEVLHKIARLTTLSVQAISTSVTSAVKSRRGFPVRFPKWLVWKSAVSPSMSWILTLMPSPITDKKNF